jgi:hypothetical protein
VVGMAVVMESDKVCDIGGGLRLGGFGSIGVVEGYGVVWRSDIKMISL